MNKHVFLASITVFSLAVAVPALALNPQPLPPGKNKVGNAMTNQTNAQGHNACTTVGSATGGAGSGRACAHGLLLPAVRKAGGTQMNVGNNAATTHGFNPQPDPPGSPVAH